MLGVGLSYVAVHPQARSEQPRGKPIPLYPAHALAQEQSLPHPPPAYFDLVQALRAPEVDVARVETLLSQLKSHASESAAPPAEAVIDEEDGVCEDGSPGCLWRVVSPQLYPFLVDDVARGRATRPRRRGGVVIVPGGGDYSLAIGKEGFDVARWLNTLGIDAFVLKHRVDPSAYGLPTALAAEQDLRRALRVVRSLAPSLGLDEARIGTLSFSAGAFPVYALQFEDGDKPERLLVDDAVDGLKCASDFDMYVYPMVFETFPEMSTRRPPPPSFFAQVDDRDAVTPMLRFYELLRGKRRARGLPALSELHLYPGTIHGWGVCNASAWRREAWTRVLQVPEWPQRPRACEWTTPAAAFMERLMEV